MKLTIPSVVLLCSIGVANAAISLAGPSVGYGWTPLGANYDFANDQQTGDPASDIVGTADAPDFFTAFQSDYPLSPAQTGSALAFRVRLDAAGGSTGAIMFNRNIWVGIDADLNGSLDVFIGVATQGSNVTLGIFATGAGSNTSPSTTTIGNAAYSYTTSSASYDYRAVNYLSDGGTLNDLTPGGTDTDYYVSFVASFSDLAAFISNQLPTMFNETTPFTENTPIAYVLGTSTETKSLNQDIRGINNLVVTKNTAITWTDLDAFSSPTITPSAIVPECSAGLLAFIGSVVGFAIKRRR